MRNTDKMAKSFFGLKIEDSAHFENVKRWLGVCCGARTWENVSEGAGIVLTKDGTNHDTSLTQYSQEERLVYENLPDYVEATYKKLFDEYYEKMKNCKEDEIEALATQFRIDVFKLAVKNMTGFDSLDPGKERGMTHGSCAGCGLPAEFELDYQFHISTDSLKKPFELKNEAD